MVRMKNALLKDTFREIKNTHSRFLSIFFIVALGVAFFAGVKASSKDMELTGDKYFDEYNLMDIKILSTMGLDKDDIAAIEKTQGIEQVWPAYSIDAIAKQGDKERVVKVLTMSEDSESAINRTMLIAGRYPQKDNECVIEEPKMLDQNAALGSTISLSSGTEEDLSEKLENKTFTVVGIVETPYYISYDRGTSNVGNGRINSFMMVPKSNFKLSVYTEAFIRVAGAKEAFTYSETYDDLIEATKEDLEKAAESREQLRYDELIGEAEDKLEEGRQELAKAEAEAQAELDKAAKKLAEGRQQLQTGKKQLQYKERETQAAIRAGEAQIAQGYQQLEKGEADYKQQMEVFNQSKHLLSKEQVEATQAKLQQAGSTLQATRAQLEQQAEKLTASKAQAEAEFAAGRKKLVKSEAELTKGEHEYEKAKKEADEKLAEGRQELADAQEKIDKLDKPNWYILDRSANPGYVDYDFSADRVAAIAQVFPVFFFLIAALVCLTTMTRMVDEQRTYIGTLKALGYSKVTIASKYLLYAAIASIGGSIFGVLVGFKLFPTVIFNAYSIMFTMPQVITAFNTYYAVLSTALAASITILAAWFACSKELRAEPAKLMRPKAPKAGKRIILERVRFIWTKLNFTQKITARNLFRYKKRFLMTVLGIGGCTALLLSGFGLKDSILSIAAIQFDELYRYDMVVQLKKDIAPRESPEFLQKIVADDRISDYMLIREQSVELSAGKINKTAYLVVPETASRLQDFVELRSRTTKENVAFVEEGIVLTEKLARQLQVSVGEEVSIKTENEDKAAVKVTGITEHYISHYMYMSPALYEKVFGKQVEFKQIMAKTSDTTEEFENQLSEDLLKNKDVSSVRFTTGISKDFKKIIKSLNYVILVLIFSAGALAFIVLYNLTNVNVTERLREIATIKVLGFFDREVSAYVDRESVILTFIGMLVGLVLGIFFHRYIVVTAEVEYVMFGRIIKPLSYLYAAVMTILFSLMVNLVMHFKLKKISMVESLKSVD